jgi:hypothetical protein
MPETPPRQETTRPCRHTLTMWPKRSIPERVKDIITAYGPTAASLAQLGLQWWYLLRRGPNG